jgi:hypothetical protein
VRKGMRSIGRGDAVDAGDEAPLEAHGSVLGDHPALINEHRLASMSGGHLSIQVWSVLRFLCRHASRQKPSDPIRCAR